MSWYIQLDVNKSFKINEVSVWHIFEDYLDRYHGANKIYSAQYRSYYNRKDIDKMKKYPYFINISQDLARQILDMYSFDFYNKSLDDILRKLNLEEYLI
jgi:hypothetical protein